MTNTAAKQHGSLLRILGIVFGIAAVVGGMVGQGILRTPGIVAGAVHSPALIVTLWLVGAGLVAVSAFAYVELAAAIPRAGGPYDYARRAFGPIAGVITGWAAWLVIVTVAAFLAIVVAEFLHRLGILTGVGIPVIAVAVLGIFGALNWTGTRISGDSQIAFSAFKGAALIALVILLFAQPGAAWRRDRHCSAGDRAPSNHEHLRRLAGRRLFQRGTGKSRADATASDDRWSGQRHGPLPAGERGFAPRSYARADGQL
jgi:amino acid transporter